MPCWEVRTVSMEMKVANRELLEAALKREGFRIEWITTNASVPDLWSIQARRDSDGERITIANGVATTRNAQIVNTVKRAYSREAMYKAASKYGWQLSPQRGTTDQFVAQRRG